MTVPASPKPLSVWIAAALLAAAILLVLSCLQRTSWLLAPGGTTADFNLQRLQALPHGAPHVVALGSSKTIYAIDFDQVFAERIALRGRSVVFNRITALDPQYSDFRPALAAIAQRPPDVLLVEAELLLLDRSGDAPAAALDRVHKNMALAWRRLSGVRTDYARNDNRGLEDWPSASSCRQSKNPSVLRMYAGYAEHWRTTTADERAPYLAYLRRMHAAGTRIVLLGVPRSPAATGVVPDAVRQQAALLRDRLVKDEGFIAWDPGAMGESLYCDQMHVNRSGRAFYAAWLAKQLAGLLATMHG